jgi:hypothetical protein
LGPVVDLAIGDVITSDYLINETLEVGQFVLLTFVGDFQYQFSLSFYQGQIVSFTNELKDFNIKDFITEILNRFALTPFKDKYTNHYKFLTLQELLQDNSIVDWSREKNKFVEKISERYIYGSYAQENNFAYKYNDNESDYYNSEILINNVNLADAKTVVNSRVYAPEKDPTFLIHDLQTNVYKMWNKEVKDNGDVEYKGLQKRYYLMRENTYTFTDNTQIGSQSAGLHQAITTIPVESFYNLRMEDIVRNYYKNIGSILNLSKMVDATIYLNETDIANIDFSKLYWIEQLSSYFILNKISNFTKKGITKVELIKVDYTGSSNAFPKTLIEENIILVPRIHLGLGQVIGEFQARTPFTIYQDTIYNANEYQLPTTPIGATLISRNMNSITVEFATTGTYTVTTIVASTSKGVSITSNELTITIT